MKKPIKQYVEVNAYNTTISNLQKEIKELKILLSKQPSDNSNLARNALSKCTEYKHRSQEREKDINDIYNNVVSIQSDISKNESHINIYKKTIINTYNASKDAQDKINTLNTKIDTVDEIFTKKESLKQNIDELSDIYNDGTDLSNKIDAIYNGIKTKKNDIETLSYEIFGYDEEDEKNEEKLKHIDGLKDKLKKSYNDIVNDTKTLQEKLEEINDNSNEKYEELIINKQDKFNSLIKEIEALLPKALTAGLSHAFSQKRQSERAENRHLQRIFIKTIKWLIGISAIPFAISIILFFKDISLLDVIKDMPRIVLSILPLYIPVIWLAYSTNKKINLSKRLIEEYTHKEVLSKTFEGLSKQIENLEDKDVSAELKIKLLHNILSVSSENPGKLISDYNTSDHPLMDALDKSAKLNDAIDSISKIPGLSKLSTILENRATKLNQEQEKKISTGLNDAEQSKQKKSDKPVEE